MKNFTPEGVQDVVTVDADGALVLLNLLDIVVVVFAGRLLEALDGVAVLALVAEGAEDQDEDAGHGTVVSTPSSLLQRVQTRC